VGRFLSRPPVLVVLLVGALPFMYLAFQALRAFIRDLRYKQAYFGSRFVRLNSELLILGLLFAANALIMVLHAPLRGLLPEIYRLMFQYLLPFLSFFLKAMLISFVVLWLRWTLPRLRVDQLMSVCWRYLIPMGFFCLIGQGVWMCLFGV
jgi:NADH:ubiquinone oxidoreductase subunit H